MKSCGYLILVFIAGFNTCHFCSQFRESGEQIFLGKIIFAIILAVFFGGSALIGTNANGGGSNE